MCWVCHKRKLFSCDTENTIALEALVLNVHTRSQNINIVARLPMVTALVTDWIIMMLHIVIITSRRKQRSTNIIANIHILLTKRSIRSTKSIHLMDIIVVRCDCVLKHLQLKVSILINCCCQTAFVV